MRQQYYAVAAAAVLCSCAVFVAPSASQSPTVEYQVKAAFLYNFAQFVEWPSQAFSSPSDPFTFCLVGDPFEGALEKTLQGETLGGRPLAARRIGAPEDVRGCQLVYVGLSEVRRSAEIINAAANAPILMVGETEEFINAGGMIRFTQSGQRIRFEINPDAAERASLKVSSRLLRLADIVRPRRRAGSP
ncbi:MAG TPA: YfiR family protein [Terriglobia bacterium]|nr:YfiR family protein [Terriglobia bacterium]